MNIYSVLDDSDTEEQPKVVADKKAKDAKPAAAAPKKDAGKPAAKAPEAKKGENAQPANANKPKATAVAEKPKNAAPADATNESAGKDDNRGGKPRGKEYRERGGRGGRGGAEGAADGERRPKREFERRSGTGRGREVSKGGRGSFGFGNPAQDAQDAEKDPNAAEVAVEAVDEAAVEPEEVAEPEPVTFTMDEFMEKRNQARKALLEANSVKVRTVDESSLAGLSRKEDEGETTYMPVKTVKAEASKKDQRSTAKTAVLDVAFKFAAIQVDNDRGGRGGRGESGRGGRGEGRGRGSGRGDGRAPSSRGPSSGASKGFNPADFPSL